MLYSEHPSPGTGVPPLLSPASPSDDSPTGVTPVVGKPVEKSFISYLANQIQLSSLLYDLLL
jgi:hypothetical protein